MAREYTVYLDGTTRTLKYKVSDREAIEELFLRGDGTPTSLWTLMSTHLVGAGSIKVQKALLWGGLRHLGEKWTLEKVGTDLQRALDEGTLLKDINTTVFKALMISGVLGESRDMDALAEAAATGKDETAAT